MVWRFLLVLICFFISVSVLQGKTDETGTGSVLSTNSSSFYDTPSGKRGWWWYETEKNIKSEKKEKDDEVKREKAEKQLQEKQKEFKEEVKPLTEYTYEELLYMEPKKFRELFNYYLERAIAQPTEENLFYYFNLVDVARKKAALFSYMYDYTMQKYAQYLPTTVYPVSVPGIEARIERQKDEILKYVLGKKNDYGLIVFIQPGCPYCEAQIRILDRASIDGINIKYVDITRYPESISKFGIEVTPTIIIVHRNGQYLTIGSGVQALDTIYFAIYRALRIFEGEDPARATIYEFQRLTPLDPYEPPPLWRKKGKIK